MPCAICGHIRRSITVKVNMLYVQAVEAGCARGTGWETCQLDQLNHRNGGASGPLSSHLSAPLADQPSFIRLRDAEASSVTFAWINRHLSPERRADGCQVNRKGTP